VNSSAMLQFSQRISAADRFFPEVAQAVVPYRHAARFFYYV
jgi:hypothetical protein